jgi:phosphinothricin acetyltransferase
MRTAFGATIRPATRDDIAAIRTIYNQGIEDRIATLELDPKSEAEVATWLIERGERYEVIVAETDGRVMGWAALNPYSHRCAYNAVADLSIYVERNARQQGIGEQLLTALEERAKGHNFHKIVLFTFAFNEGGRRLYRKRGFREIGVFHEQGKLDGRFVDVMAMEKLLLS